MSAEKPYTVLFDTNIFMLAAQKPLNIFLETGRVLGVSYKAVTLNLVIDEIKEKILRGGPKERMHAKLALELARKCEVVNVELKGFETTDEAIVEKAYESRWIVATNDRKLRRVLKEKSIPTIFLRGYKRLVLEGGCE